MQVVAQARQLVGTPGIVRVANMPPMGIQTTETVPSSARDQLAGLARVATSGLVSSAEAARAWKVPSPVAASRLHRLVRAGWLVTVRKGLFLVRPLEGKPGARTTVEDPWVLASRLFAPCYIGGWSAAEHWGLTEQLFRSTFVVTGGPARSRTVEALGCEFRTVRATPARIAAASSLWRGPVRVSVSDREQTLADALQHPGWVGGAGQLADLLRSYRESEHWSPVRLLRAVAKVGKGAAYKRLGYLAEAELGGEPSLVAAALGHRSAGLIKLDPSVAARGAISKRWGLRVNVRPRSGDDSA